MKVPIGAATAALSLVCLTWPTMQATAQIAGGPPPNPQIETSYVRPSNRNFQPIFDRLQNRKPLEELRQFMGALKLPKKLTVKVDECGGKQRTPYKSGGPATLCYEVIDRIEKVGAKVDAGKRTSVIAGAFIQAMLHEVAFGVLDNLEVPVWGRMGDASDRFAALVMLKFGEDVAERAIAGASEVFKASDHTWTGSEFASPDSPDTQRYYNYLCIAYGGSPITFRYLATGSPPPLTEHRVPRCAGEYRQVLKAFDLRVMPYVDPDLLVRVRATRWLLATDIK